MRAFFAISLACLVALSITAANLGGEKDVQDKKVLVWASDNNPVRQEQIDLFNKLNSEYHLKLDPNNNGMEKVIVQSLGGVGPDLFDCYDPASLHAFVRAGIAYDVTDDLKREGIDPKEEVWPATLAYMQHEGRVYGFPTNACVNAIWFHKDIFDKYGIPAPEGPWTWEEYIPIAQRLTVRDGNGRVSQYGMLLDWFNWPSFLYQWGGHIYSEDGTKCTLDSPEAIAGIQFMRDLIYKYKICPTPTEESTMSSVGGWGSGVINLFGSKRAAMAVGGRWWLCTLRQWDGLELGAVELPHGRYRVSYGYGRATLVNATGRNRKEAVRFLKYLAGREYNEMVNHKADAIAPVKRYSYTDEYLYNPQYPKEDFNAVWRDSMAYAKPMEFSPFINGHVASRIIGKQLDLVRSDLKTPEAAMKTAAKQVNEEIQKSIQLDPTLRARYMELMEAKSRQ